MNGRSCRHVAFRGETVDWQRWVEQGGMPFIRKLAISYREVPGVPQYVAWIDDWETPKIFSDGRFTCAEAVSAGHRAVLVAKNEEGYGNLCRLLSELHCRKDFSLSQRLEAFRSGLIVLSDDPAVLVPLRYASPEDLYIELSSGHRMEQTLKLARELDLPPVERCFSIKRMSNCIG